MTDLSKTRDAEALTPMGRRRPWIMALIGAAGGALLLGAGGRWDWWEGWCLAAAFFAYLVGTSVWVVRYAPGLSNERVRAVAHPGTLTERLILVWAVVVLAALMGVSALDGGRFRWSHVPPAAKLAGWLVLAGYFALNLWVMAHNAFLSAVVRVQTERGHTVVTTGPYRAVRHPMYAALCLLAAGLPLALGSWWGLIPGGLLALTFVFRTDQEDRFLMAHLAGYAEYAQRTRYRLVPGVW
jgi:protein-S-isoprenylcysteine O-methyltransferase Ste14